MTSNDLLYDAMIRRQIFVLRHAAFIRQQYLARLRRRNATIIAIIAMAYASAETPAARYRAAGRAAREIRRIEEDGWSEELLLALLLALAMDEVRALREMLLHILPVRTKLRLPSEQRLDRELRSRLMNNRRVRDWVRSAAAAEQRRTENALRTGGSLGEGADQLAGRVVGRRGVTKQTQLDVDGISRTTATGTTALVRQIVGEMNSDLFSEEIYSAVLDSRTTPLCRSLDGNIYPIGEGPYPPVHFNCRSVRNLIIRPDIYRGQGVTVAVEQEALNLIGVTSRGDADPVKFRRAVSQVVQRLIGGRPRRMGYEAWLRGQSATFQDDVLGKTRAALFRRGGLPLNRFVNRRGDELSLSKLADREAQAFRAAGLSPSDYID